jgi:hypothetical protein
MKTPHLRSATTRDLLNHISQSSTGTGHRKEKLDKIDRKMRKEVQYPVLQSKLLVNGAQGLLVFLKEEAVQG